jgi:hypothetical protein
LAPRKKKEVGDRLQFTPSHVSIAIFSLVQNEEIQFVSIEIQQICGIYFEHNRRFYSRSVVLLSDKSERKSSMLSRQILQQIKRDILCAILIEIETRMTIRTRISTRALHQHELDR